MLASKAIRRSLVALGVAAVAGGGGCSADVDAGGADGTARNGVQPAELNPRPELPRDLRSDAPGQEGAAQQQSPLVNEGSGGDGGAE